MNIVITRFPYESQLGGMETMVLNLAKGLSAKGHTVSFVGSCHTLLSLFEEHDFRVTKIVAPKAPVTKKSLLLFTLFYPFAWYQMRRVLHDMKQGDVLYMLSLSEKIILTKMAYSRGIKVVWGEHESLMQASGGFKKWLAQNPYIYRYRFLSQYAEVVTVSGGLQKEFVSLGGVQNVSVISNGIDTTMFSSKQTKSSRERVSPFVVGMVARCKKEKGIDLFLDVAKEVSKNIKNVLFLLVGDGDYLATAQKKIHSYKLTNIVEVLPDIAHEHIPAIYARFDVGVFLSQEKETFGLAPLECMAMKRPVIMTDVYGFVDGITPIPFPIIPRKDKASLVSLLLLFFQQPAIAKKMASDCEEFVTKHFSHQKMIDAYEKLFSKK